MTRLDRWKSQWDQILSLVLQLAKRDDPFAERGLTGMTKWQGGVEERGMKVAAVTVSLVALGEQTSPD